MGRGVIICCWEEWLPGGDLQVWENSPVGSADNQEQASPRLQADSSA